VNSFVAAACWALLGAVPAPQSQRLVQLAAVADSQQAGDDFWREIDAQGTPLIERIPGKRDRVMMTFLWRAGDARAELNIGVVGVNKLSFEDRVDTMSRLGKYAEGPDAPAEPGMLTPNRSFRDLLQARGYEVTYREFVGAHNWRATFPEALISLIGTGRHGRQK
jgi:hypothetical protein